jgi:PAS domain S-box-containing protein
MLAPVTTPLARVVTGVALAGVVAILGTAWVTRRWGIGGPVVALGWLDGRPLVVTLVAFTCAAELVAVRLRHQDAVEELTLLDPMVLLNVLLLAPLTAIGVSLTGIAAAYLLRRRALIKSVFNIGTYAAAGSVLVLFLRGVAGSGGQFDLQLVAGTATGACGFVVVNVTCMSVLLAGLGAGTVPGLIRQDLRLTTFTLAATTAMSATVVTIAVHTPIFLPFTALPAVAITYAYRATATESEERARSAHVLAFSRVLAGGPTREVAVAAFLRLVRDGFFAAHALAVFDSGEVATLHGCDGVEPATGSAVGASGDVLTETVADDVHQGLPARCADGALMLDDGLPPGWSRAMLAPLEADGTRLGAVAVGWASGDDRQRSQDLTMFASLASSLATALSRAQHLARLVEETSKLRAVVDQSSDGILVLDGTGRVMVWNPALQAMSGSGQDRALGRPLGELLDSRDQDGNQVDAFAEGCRLLSAQHPHVTVDVQIVRPDGDRRSVRCAHAGTFDADGLLVRDVVNVHDLTRERQADRLKTDFIATVSHELRTPVTPIKGYAELLRARWDSIPPEKRVKALDVIADRAGHLARLVEDLLLASSISSDSEPAQSVVMGTVDLNALISRAAEDFTGAADARLRLCPAQEPVEVDCDSTRAVQILGNLLSNALKYSPEGATIEVYVERRGDHGVVAVHDHGRGIPADQLERVFEKFHRVEDPMVMQTGGSGLGLYIARHLARAMAGDLEVASTFGQGSQFTLRLPLTAAQEVKCPGCRADAPG